MTFIETHRKEKLVHLEINTGNPLNPLTVDVIEEIAEAVSGADRPVVLSGKGKAFSAGANIKNFLDMRAEDAYHFATRGHDGMNAIASASVPVIAAIHGYALGGGFELALACDFRIATPDSKLGLPEVNLGILPGFGGTQRLSSIAGESRALELISTGRTISGEEAVQLGIARTVTTDFLKSAEDFAAELSEKPPVSLKYIKRLVRKEPDDRFEQEKEKFAALFDTMDSKEGFDAFINKRKPKFSGK